MMTQNKRQPALNDTDAMPFGKYRGKLMQDVPPSYLAWLYGEMKSFSQNCDPNIYDSFTMDKIKVANYIHNSKEAIEMELGEEL